MSNELIIGITYLYFSALAVIISYANKVSSNTVDDYFCRPLLGIVVLAFTQMATILSGWSCRWSGYCLCDWGRFL